MHVMCSIELLPFHGITDSVRRSDNEFNYLVFVFFYYMCLIEADVIHILCHFLPFHTLDSLTVVLIGHLQVPVEVALSCSF